MIASSDEDSAAPACVPPRRGFLPIVTNWFDRLFISAVIWVALSLFWMRFVEPAAPLWISNLIAIALAVVIVRKG
jgi:predicted small integral membrane protein